MAEAALLAMRYEGSVAHLLHGHGFDATTSVTSAAIESGVWVQCAAEGCRYAGTPASVRHHCQKAAH
ncbi:hypothetical protein GDP17_19780 [Gordonia jinghuaiqii]|nr:hypothetical protein [Gordonia jinghuaiqii]